MKYVLGIDFGGGASKATLLDKTGKVIATANSEYPTIYGESGKAEQNPHDWFDVACKNIKTILNFGIKAEDIDCICFDAATHTAVLMDENFNVLQNSIYWTDTRSIPQKQYLFDKYGKDIFNKFKHNVDTIWTLPQLLWVKENQPEVFNKVKRIMFAKDYVRHMFTEDFYTDYIEAEGSMLFDYDKREWSKEYIELLELKKEYFPTVIKPTNIAGKITKNAASITGLSEGTPVICGTTDTAVEVFASGAINKGQITIKLATAGRICAVWDKLVPDNHIINYSHIREGLYYPGSATKSCAASLRWYRDTFGGDYESIDKDAEKISAGSDGLIFNPYLNGELTPYGNPLLRANFTGISSMHTSAHFARSVMEGVALSLLDCKEYLISKGLDISGEAFAIGGGAKSELWSSILADVLNITLLKTKNNDSSFGSAMLAGIYAGFFSDMQNAVDKCCIITGKVKPDSKNSDIYREIFKKYKKIQKAMEEIYNA